MFLADLVEDAGLGGGRGDAVDGDVVVRDLLGQGLGQRDDARLGGAVRRGVGIALLTGDRRYIDDAPVILGHHPRDYGAAAVEDTGQIDIDDLLPFGGGILPQLLRGAGDTGAIDEDVDPAKAVHRGRRGGLDRRQINF